MAGEVVGFTVKRGRVIIWECEGYPFDKVGYGLKLRRRLHRAGFSTAVVRYPRGQADPAGISEGGCCAHIWSGGSIRASERVMAPWRRILTRQIVDSASGGPMVFGICLGSQLMAAAYSGAGVVRAAGQGMEVGMRWVEAVGAEARGMISDDGMNVCQFHYEEVSPRFLERKDVRHLFCNGHSRVQGFRIGDRAFGFQFHPEFSAEDCRRIVQANRKEILSRGGNVDERGATAHAKADRRRDHFDELVVSRLRGTE